MRKCLNPKWILLVHTLPATVLAVLAYSKFSIIHRVLSIEQLQAWKQFAYLLGILTALCLLYAIFMVKQKKPVPMSYGIIALCLNIGLIYWYGMHMDDIIPLDIPEWMVSENFHLYPFTFLMPAMAHALLVTIVWVTPVDGQRKPWKDAMMAVIIPVGLYLFMQIIVPLLSNRQGDSNVHVIIVTVIAAAVAFLFFLTRAIILLVTKPGRKPIKYDLAWKVPLAIVFPLLGLAINNGAMRGDFNFGNGIFGNFSDRWFYILALANGILVCLPELDHKFYRIALFVSRCILFPYIVYFFLVFLPFLPVSVLAVIAVGIGFLMLTPLALFILQVNIFQRDVQFLRTHFTAGRLWSLAVLAILAIPMIIIISYQKEKRILNEALEYVYTPDYSKTYNIDTVPLIQTLASIKGQKDRGRFDFSVTQLPYLSALHNWMVLDNLTLSDDKIHELERVFFGHAASRNRPEMINNSNVGISELKGTSRYDSTRKAWISQVDCKIVNSSSNNFAEYATTIQLPAGCFISDYYLKINGKKEKGILAEKKAAMWIFSQIRNTNRDPGLLYYLTGNKVAWRIFPFAGNEMRESGFELVHKEPIQFTIDKQPIQLGDTSSLQQRDTVQVAGNACYVPASKKATLPVVQRKPYYHFIVDISKGKDNKKNDYTGRIERLLSKQRLPTDSTVISFVNSYVQSYKLTADWKKQYQQQPTGGGFFLDRGIRQVLFDQRTASANYPVIVVVTDSISKSLVPTDFANFSNYFPESDLYYWLDSSGQLQPHSLLNKPALPVKDSVEAAAKYTVLAYPSASQPVAYLRNNKGASVIILNDQMKIPEADIQPKNWAAALAIQGQWMSAVLNPQRMESDRLSMVRNSFRAGIMTPSTSFIVVENEAQKAMLQRKQNQILGANPSLDPGEEVMAMPEPGTWSLLLVLALLFYIKHRKQLNIRRM